MNGKVRSRREFLGVASALFAGLEALPRAARAQEAATPTAGFHEPAAGVNDAPVPITFPRDDGPHDVQIEWWYYTGHLFTAKGDRYGIEFVVFKGKQQGITGYASHFAVTDNANGTFHYDQRLDFAPADANTPRDTGFDLEVVDWRMAGVNGEDRLAAALPGYAIDLSLTSAKPPALHDGDGYIDYGSGEASYYYSRTRMLLTGTLTLADGPQPVTGEAWFDHQWGNFSTYEGGWDWYALQLDDQTEVMLYVIRAPGPDGPSLIVDGSLVAADGALTVLDRAEFVITPTGSWTSPRSGGVYPSGWEIAVPHAGLAVTVTPSLLDQELDTTASTGVTYWEGEVIVSGTRGETPLAGHGYVELTGYVPLRPIGGTPES